MEDITIPKGYDAKIEGDKIVFIKKESDDEKIRKNIITYLTGMRDETLPNRMIQPIFDDWIAYLEKQGEQKPKMIQWTGKNLKEVIDFTGKSPRFDEWFKSWEDFENYVHSHGDIFKLFCEDGSHLEVPVGAWIVKTPDGFNTPSHFRFIQKPTEWSKKDERIKQDIENLIYFTLKDGSAVSYAANTTKEDALNWLKSLHPQPKQEWNEEDEKMRVSIILTLASFMGNEEKISWLKSLPERFNPQAGLSKENFVKFGNLEYERGKQDGIQSAERTRWKPSEQEKGALSTAIHVLTEERNFPRAAEQLQNILNTFEGKESCKDWKPSKEQLAALERSYRACYGGDICSLDDGYQLRELYNKLIEVQ